MAFLFIFFLTFFSLLMYYFEMFHFCLAAVCGPACRYSAYHGVWIITLWHTELWKWVLRYLQHHRSSAVREWWMKATNKISLILLSLLFCFRDNITVIKVFFRWSGKALWFWPPFVNYRVMEFKSVFHVSNFNLWSGWQTDVVFTWDHFRFQDHLCIWVMGDIVLSTVK